MQFLLTLMNFSGCFTRMESLLLLHIVQMPVAGVPDRNRCRLHLDNAKQEVPGKKELRQNKCIRHTLPRRFQRLPDDVNVQHPSDLHDLQRKGTAESRLPQGGRGRPRGNPQRQLQLPRHRPGRLNANTGAATPPQPKGKHHGKDRH